MNDAHVHEMQVQMWKPNTWGVTKSSMTMPCKPKDEGHLCDINLRTEMKHSLQKNLHKYFNKEDIPWVHKVWEKNYSNGKLSDHPKKGSYLWRDILKLLDSSKGILSPLVRSLAW